VAAFKRNGWQASTGIGGNLGPEYSPYDQRKAQCPDLLCFKPDYTDWFFCEVKGPTDKLRDEQREYFSLISSVSKKPIQVIKLRWRK